MSDAIKRFEAALCDSVSGWTTVSNDDLREVLRLAKQATEPADESKTVGALKKEIGALQALNREAEDSSVLQEARADAFREALQMALGVKP